MFEAQNISVRREAARARGLIFSTVGKCVCKTEWEECQLIKMPKFTPFVTSTSFCLFILLP